MARSITTDGNTAASHVAYAFSEVAAIYPISPSSVMGENTDMWSSIGRKNLWGKTVSVAEMQSEAGAAGAVHGSLCAGALTSTFTASQGLLLKIPNMYKIAGEMLPLVMHVAARSLATQSLSIFGDHSDVMSVRMTGFAMTAASNIQETTDMALIAHLSTLKAQVPFLSFFDGFRTSHEIQTIEEISYETIKELVEEKYIQRFRNRAMRPEAPIAKVSAQNPDVYFQGRESVNSYYDALPELVQEYMDKVAAKTGRAYKLFDYVGAPDAEKVIVSMGSSCDTVEHTVKHLNKLGQKLGLIKVRLYRPFSAKHFLQMLPDSCKKVIVLDRTKEPGSLGEPLYMDVVQVLANQDIKVIGGRYGLSSKEFTPSHVNAVFQHADNAGFHGFTVGINDDVTNLSIEVNEEISVEPDDITSCTFWGLGSDGTVGANKNSIKIIGDNTDLNAQAYFVYDSKKSGGITVSHLRFGKSSVNMPWLVTESDFVACHNPAYIDRYDMISGIKPGGTFLLNSEYANDEVFDKLSREMQEVIIERKIKFYNINALKISQDAGLGKRINTVMQAAFFKLSGVMKEEEAIKLIKNAIKNSFMRKGEDIVEMNWKCVDAASAALQQIDIPKTITKSFKAKILIDDTADDFAREVILPTMMLRGDEIPVSKMPFDGVLPTGTAKIEKRGIAASIPKWIDDTCIQCNQCAMSCPHAAIRAKQILPEELECKPATFDTLVSKTKNERKLEYKIQMYIEDCTGCGVCVDVCPTKEKSLVWSPIDTERKAGENENEAFFESLTPNIIDGTKLESIKGSQFKDPLFEFSGACSGCGETPYLKLMTQMFGNRIVAANATGCSSIYGGTFPTIPYSKDERGHGPAWGNSLFEDNAEYGFGMRLAIDSNRHLLKIKIDEILESGISDVDLTAALKKNLELWDNTDEEAIVAQMATGFLLAKADQSNESIAKAYELKDYFVDKSLWIIGGDGWANDIGYGGIDHVVAQDKNVNILVLDTEVYSNTGGQASKATPIAAVAAFANAGKRSGKKNLGFMCATYGGCYVACVSMGANRMQTINAFKEAEAWDGPSIIIAYSPCIAHGIDMSKTSTVMKNAVDSGYFPLYRFNPANEAGKKFSWDSKKKKMEFQDFLKSERRYTALLKTAPEQAEGLFQEAQDDMERQMTFMQEVGPLL